MTDFHFIRPWWLLALALIAVIAYLLKHLRVSQSGWQQVIPKHLSATLLSAEHQKQSSSALLPCLIAFLAIIALAGPAWEKLPQPVYNVKKGAVVILDLSTSMYATDISPNRITRARFKVLDLLEKLSEGDVGLIAYAGDSFVISPLTEDVNNIKLLLPELAPEMMPVQGSNPLLALTMANDMLLNSGHIEGDIYWLTDEADQYDVEEITSFFTSIKHHINILGVGTRAGAPIKLPNGQLLKDNSGAIVVPHLTESELSSLAQRGRGSYQTLTNSTNDINLLVENTVNKSLKNIKEQETNNTENKQISESDKYQEAGPYLLLLLLPLLLPYFRRGGLFALLPLCFWFSHVPDSYAQSSVNHLDNTGESILPENESTVKENHYWSSLWQTQNQQAQKKYQNKEYDAAAKQFTDAMWQGSAHYKNGNFAEALSAFEQLDSAEALYNQGNSLAKLGQLEEALTAYNNALKKTSDLVGLNENKHAVEEAIQQQKQQQNQNQDNKQGDSEDNSEKNPDEQSSDNSEQGSEQNTDKNAKNENSDQEDNSQEKSNEEGSNSQSDDQQSREESNGSKENSNNNSDENSENDTSKQNENNENSSPSEEELAEYKKALEEELKKQEKNTEQRNLTNEATDKNDPTPSDDANKTQVLNAEEQAALEDEQHKQQLFKKLTDNPGLLLRNKMQLEYKKRRQERQSSGVNKQW